MIAQSLLDALPLGALVTDQALHVLQLNRWLIQRLDPAQVTLVGEPLGVIFPELLEHNLLAAYQMVLQHGQSLSLPTSVHRYVVRLPAPAGSGLPEMAQATTLVPLFESGALCGTLTLIQDVSQGLAAERHLQREIDRLTALHEVDSALATLDLQTCLQVIVNRTRTLFAGENAVLLLVEAEGLRVAAAAGFAVDVIDRRIALGEGLTGWVAVQRRAALVADVTTDPRYLMVEPRARAEMAAPLLAHGDCIGVINVECAQVGAYTQDDLEMLEMLAARAAVAIQNARLHAAERQLHALAATLQDIGLRLSMELDPEAVLDTLLDYVVGVVPYDTACIMLLDPRGERVWVERQRGYEQYGVTTLMLSFRRELQGLKHLARMAATRRPATVPYVLGDPDWVASEVSAHIRSWAGAPITARGQVLGFLSLDKTEPGFYTPEMAERLEAFAAQAGLALENARLYAEQQRLAVTDGLTGIANRRYFDQALAREVQRAGRFQRATSLILLDLDDFKLYNDTHGHLAGDELLRAVAVTLAQSLRGADTVARFGGEEFAIILPETELDAALQAAERLRQIIAHLPLQPAEAGPRPVTISLGVCASPLHGLTPTELVNAADRALYRAKARGKNQAAVFADSLPAATGRR